ncbi:MAG TPA: hypothetical protein VMR49_00945 [Candidatus Paceibacterota bacterium]|jgi:hypothetical protein|nr:hypothetical protein [Candidatus Paceibacterota bacterium]
MHVENQVFDLQGSESAKILKSSDHNPEKIDNGNDYDSTYEHSQK